jgi:putative ABC transport system permease protein
MRSGSSDSPEVPRPWGGTLTLNGNVYTIVGVAGAGFLTYDSYEVKLWAPVAATTWSRDSRGFHCYARLADGISVAQAQLRLDAISKRLAEAYPETNKEYGAQVEPLLDEFHKLARPAVLGLSGFVLCLLLISAANVASLLLARATKQARELSIRAALGANRLRLYRMMMAESIMLALLASVGGAVLAIWLLEGARALLPVTLRYSWVFAISGRVFGAALLVAAVTGLLAGIAPAFEGFRLAAGGLRPSLRRQRVLRTIVTVEVALAVVLFVGAGLLGKSFVELLNRPLGYDTEQLLGMRIRLRAERYEGYDRKAAYWAELVERAGALPGVDRAAAVSDQPMGWQYSGSSFEVAGQEIGPEEERPRAHHLIASPGYFSTIGIPIIAGRGFTESDGPESEPVVIVNDLLAETFWPGQSAIGQQIKLGNKWQKIVGVARRIRHAGPHDGFENQTYRPYRQVNYSTMFLVLRTHVPPESVVTAVRDVLHSLDPNVPAFEIRSMEAALNRETALPRMPMVFATVFAGLAGLLASLGLMGVIAYWVSQRARELGIRSALGAQRHALRALVLRQGVRLSLLGLAIGLAVSLAVMRFLRSLLYGMSELDPWVYASATALVLVTTLLACWLPAAQAARTNPASALRDE